MYMYIVRMHVHVHTRAHVDVVVFTVIKPCWHCCARVPDLALTVPLSFRALLRPGRFDVTVSVMLPDKKGRKEILEHYLAKIKRKDVIDTDSLAKRTVGFSGADLENVINQAALKAVIDNAKLMTNKHIEWAKDKIQMG